MNRIIKLCLECLFVLTIASTLSIAVPSPITPIGSTLWHSGDQVTIKWTDDGKPPRVSSMTGIKIQLMTGPDLSQIPLYTIAENLTNTETQYILQVPQLGYPSGQIYFLMFSDPIKPGVGVSWSTRFTVQEGNNSLIHYSTGEPWTFTESPQATVTNTVIVTSGAQIATTAAQTIPVPSALPITPTPTPIISPSSSYAPSSTQDSSQLDIPDNSTQSISPDPSSNSNPASGGNVVRMKENIVGMILGLTCVFVFFLLGY